MQAISPQGAVVNYTMPVATDLVDGTDPVVTNHPSGSLCAPGTTVVTLTSTDQHGNTTTHTFDITVVVTTPPPPPPTQGSPSSTHAFQPGVAQPFTVTYDFFFMAVQAHFPDGTNEGPQLLLPLFLFTGDGFMPFFLTVSSVTFDASGNGDLAVSAVDGMPLSLHFHFDPAGTLTNMSFS
jgi:hypothetical protein